MNSNRILQVASTFSCTPIELDLRRVTPAGLLDEIQFVKYTQISEFLLSAAPASAEIIGTLVLLRVEDWLRDDMIFQTQEASHDTWVRQQIRARADEFISQLSLLAGSRKKVWFLLCPSTGWIAQQYGIVTLVRTLTNLIATRVRTLPKVSSLSWPTFLTPGSYEAVTEDQSEHLPFTPLAFDKLGEYLGQYFVQTFAAKAEERSEAPSEGTSALAAYLRGLQVTVQLTPAISNDREHIDRLLRSTSSFTLTGEKPVLSATELDTLLAMHTPALIFVADRVLDYGPCGLVLFCISGEALVVSEMALSCTVLGKQVEYAVLEALAELASQFNAERIEFLFVPTKRNQSILRFLQSFGDSVREGVYAVLVQTVKDKLKSATVDAAAWSLAVATFGPENTRVPG